MTPIPMQEIIRIEVRNYMTCVEQHNNQQGSGDGGGGMCTKQTTVVKRIGMSKID
ncbi:hypothetical protein Hanom_Chr00s000006g01613481 [Helianthus anomalus]